MEIDLKHVARAGLEPGRTLRRASPLVASLIALGLLATACSGRPTGVGDAGSPSSSGSTKPGPLAYSQCMRSHGVPKFPDPNAQGGFAIQAGPDLDPDSPQFKAAKEACKSFLPGPGPGGPERDTENRAAALKYSQCMRNHGISGFPDPNAEGGISLDRKPGSNLDPDSPQFKAADEACIKLMPGGGRGRGTSRQGGAP